MLFDSGIKRREVYKLPLEKDLYVMWGDKLWIPVEMTLLNQSFHQAWQAGAEKLSGLDRRHLVETALAWQEYAPAAPSFEG